MNLLHLAISSFTCNAWVWARGRSCLWCAPHYFWVYISTCLSYETWGDPFLSPSWSPGHSHILEDQLGHGVLPYLQIDCRLMHGSEKGWCLIWSALTWWLRTKNRRAPRLPSCPSSVHPPISGHWLMFLAVGETLLCSTKELSPSIVYLMSCGLDFVRKYQIRSQAVLLPRLNAAVLHVGYTCGYWALTEQFPLGSLRAVRMQPEEAASLMKNH